MPQSAREPFTSESRRHVSIWENPADCGSAILFWLQRVCLHRPAPSGYAGGSRPFVTMAEQLWAVKRGA